MNYKAEILNKFKKKSATIGIVGLGYVGLPLSLSFVEKGIKTIGIDIDENKILSIRNKKSYIHHISSQRIKNAVENRLLTVTTEFKKANETDALIICVPTPLDIYRQPDLTYIKNTISKLKPHLKSGQILSLESTTYPGTTNEEIKPELENLEFKLGVDFFLVYSPEREDPGNENFNTSNIPKVIGGSTQNCTEVGTALYKLAINTLVQVSSTDAAEMTKLLENIHRSVNIGLVNELKPIAAKMGLDIYEIIRAASTKPFGFVPYYPGPGLGGHCLPIDPFYLTWKAKKYGMNSKFIELAGEINTYMPIYVFNRVVEVLNSFGKPIKNSKILILGLSYKKNVDDLRESPSLKIIDLLIKQGAYVSYSDPYFHKLTKVRKYYFNLTSEEINKKNLKSYDLVILCTDHDCFDYEIIENNSKVIVDTRGRLSNKSNVFRA